MTQVLPGRVRRGDGPLRFVGGAPSAQDADPLVIATARRGLCDEYGFRTPMDWGGGG